LLGDERLVHVGHLLDEFDDFLCGRLVSRAQGAQNTQETCLQPPAGRDPLLRLLELASQQVMEVGARAVQRPGDLGQGQPEVTLKPDLASGARRRSLEPRRLRMISWPDG
jgi:hypothetical protein